MKDKRMSKKETDMVYIFECIVKGEINQKKGAELLGLSERQVRRKQRRYEAEGGFGLAHRNRGKPSNRRLPEELIMQIKDLLTTVYCGYGPTLAAEKLAQNHQIFLNHETLRRLMMTLGFWQVRARRLIEHVWRERKHHFGELVQVDGSYHVWFGNQYSTLIAFIDDATSTIELHFADFETTASLSAAMQSYLKKHGRPRALYADCGRVYKVNRGKDDQPRETQFVRMLGELDVKMINAYSPQAKGRVERLFKTLQDRLVKELALLKIRTIEEANNYLQTSFINEINEKISVAPKQGLDLHRSIEQFNLKTIFCHKEERKLNKDRTISYHKKWFLLTKSQPVRLFVGSIITVCCHFDGTMTLLVNGIRLDYKEINKPIPHKKKENELYKADGRGQQSKPAKNHPWKGKFKVPKPAKPDTSTELKSGHF